jgi:VanZ family protein
LIWLSAVTVWTALLLTSTPVEVGHQVLEEWWHLVLSKTLHMTGYGIITALAAWLRVPWPKNLALLGFIICHAVTTEYLQSFVALRSASPRDVLFNMLGISIGFIVTRQAWRTIY